MFEVFLKKQQYGKVSSKFKDHFEQRDTRVGFVTSKDTKIQEKMQIFKSLINDGVNLEKKPTIKKAAYFRQKKKPEVDSLFNQQIHELGQMTDGFIEWNNSKLQKNKHKENIFNWNEEKTEKYEKKHRQSSDFGDALKARLNLRELRQSKKNQKLQTQIKARIYNDRLLKDSSKNNLLTYRHSPQRKEHMIELERQNQKSKYKLAKYFGEMKDFSCHKKFSHDNSSSVPKQSQAFKSMNSTAYCTSFSYQRSGTFTPCQSVSRIALSDESDTFRDDKLKIDPRNMQNMFFQGQIEPQIHSSVPLEEMLILNNKNYKLEIMSKSLQNWKISSWSKKYPMKIYKQNTSTQETEKQRNVFRTTAKCPFDIKKLNAVKKVQCL